MISFSISATKKRQEAVTSSLATGMIQAPSPSAQLKLLLQVSSYACIVVVHVLRALMLGRAQDAGRLQRRYRLALNTRFQRDNAVQVARPASVTTHPSALRGCHAHGSRGLPTDSDETWNPNELPLHGSHACAVCLPCLCGVSHACAVCLPCFCGVSPMLVRCVSHACAVCLPCFRGVSGRVHLALHLSAGLSFRAQMPGDIA